MIIIYVWYNLVVNFYIILNIYLVRGALADMCIDMNEINNALIAASDSERSRIN